MPPLAGAPALRWEWPSFPRLSPWARLCRPWRGLRCRTFKLTLMGRCPRLFVWLPFGERRQGESWPRRISNAFG